MYEDKKRDNFRGGRQWVFFFFLFAVLMGATGCFLRDFSGEIEQGSTASSGTGGAPVPFEQKLEIGSRSVELNTEILSALGPISENLLSIPVQVASASGIKPGSILMGGVTAKTPLGMMRRVESMTVSGNQVILKTSIPPIEEAIENCDLRFDLGSPSPSILTRISSSTIRREIIESSEGALGMGFKMTVSPPGDFPIKTTGIIDLKFLGFRGYHRLIIKNRRRYDVSFSQLEISGKIYTEIEAGMRPEHFGKWVKTEEVLWAKAMPIGPVVLSTHVSFPIKFKPEIMAKGRVGFDIKKGAFGIGTLKDDTPLESGNSSIRSKFLPPLGLLGPSASGLPFFDLSVDSPLREDPYFKDSDSIGNFWDREWFVKSEWDAEPILEAEGQIGLSLEAGPKLYTSLYGLTPGPSLFAGLKLSGEIGFQSSLEEARNKSPLIESAKAKLSLVSEAKAIDFNPPLKDLLKRLTEQNQNLNARDPEEPSAQDMLDALVTFISQGENGSGIDEKGASSVFSKFLTKVEESMPGWLDKTADAYQKLSPSNRSGVLPSIYTYEIVKTFSEAPKIALQIEKHDLFKSAPWYLKLIFGAKLALEWEMWKFEFPLYSSLTLKPSNIEIIAGEERPLNEFFLNGEVSERTPPSLLKSSYKQTRKWEIIDPPSTDLAQISFRDGQYYFSANPNLAGYTTFTLRMTMWETLSALASRPCSATCRITVKPQNEEVRKKQIFAQSLGAGPSTRYVLREDGTVWGWGTYLGDGKVTNPATKHPQPIPGLKNIKKIAMTWENLLALDVSGQVWILGPNYGYLGKGNNEPVYTVERLPGLPGIADIGGDDSGHAFALDSAGRYWAWGKNHYNELGVGEYSLKVLTTPRQVVVSNAPEGFYSNQMVQFWPGNTSFAKTADGQCYQWGRRPSGSYYVNDGYLAPASIPVILNVKNGEAGQVVLDGNGKIWTWGNNRHLFGHSSSLAREVVLGFFFKEKPGMLDLPAKMVKLLVAGDVAMALDENGNIWEWGFFIGVMTPGQNLSPVNETSGLPGNIQDFDLGNFTALLKTRNGDIYELLLAHSMQGRSVRKLVFSTTAPPDDTSTPILGKPVLSDVPIAITNAQDIQITVAGENIFVYKYRLDSGAWSDEIPVTVKLSPPNLADGKHTLEVLGGNGSGDWQSEATTYTWTVDRTAPTVTLSTTASSPTNVVSIPVTIEFSEPVTGFDLAKVTVNNGLKGGLTELEPGKKWTFAVQPVAPGSVTIDIVANSIVDLGGNTNTASSQLSVWFDNQPPTFVISSSRANPTNQLAPIPIIVTFNENVTGFGPEKVTVTNAALGSFTTVSASVYAFEITINGTGHPKVEIEIAEVWDTLGNKNSASGTYIHQVQGADGADVTIDGSVYVLVPVGALPDGTIVPAFYCGKYPASAGVVHSAGGKYHYRDTYQPEGNGTFRQAATTPEGRPWVYNNFSGVKAACNAAGCQLITENQWLSIAHQTMGIAANWRNGIVGSTEASGGGFYRGLSESTVSRGQPAVGGDAGANPANTSLEYRIKVLPNNARIWDIGGNVWQFVDKIQPVDTFYTGSPFKNWIETNRTDITNPNIKTPYDHTFGVGQIYNSASSTAEFVLYRGGNWSGTTYSGSFALSTNLSLSGAMTSLGFRCTRQ